MKRAVVIVGGICFLGMVYIVGAFYWILDTTEKEERRDRTDKARKARWKEKEPGPELQETPFVIVEDDDLKKKLTLVPNEKVN